MNKVFDISNYPTIELILYSKFEQNNVKVHIEVRQNKVFLVSSIEL